MALEIQLFAYFEEKKNFTVLVKKIHADFQKVYFGKMKKGPLVLNAYCFHHAKYSLRKASCHFEGKNTIFLAHLVSPDL